MRRLRLLFLLCFVSLACGQSANKTIPKTEAQQDGFSGPVHSVRMLSDSNSAPWTVSGNGGRRVALPASRLFMLVASLTCHVCDYDEQGNRTRSGQFITNSKNERVFVGSDIAIIRDSAGRMVERTVTDSGSGKLLSHDWFGPFGMTESLLYRAGKLTGSRTRTYDSAGHLTEDVFTDADGNTVKRVTVTYDNQGQWINRALVGAHGELRRLETYDPATDTQHYQEFNSSNALKTEFVVAKNRMLSYWSTSEVPGINSGISTEYFPGSDVYNFQCHMDGYCETFCIHYTYLDGDYNVPTSVERHDASGALTDAAYVEYTVDDHHNWITRKVWLVSPELPDRTLYQVDARSITYWPR